MFARSTILVVLCALIVNGVACTPRQRRLERDMESLERRKQPVLRIVRPYGTGREAAMLNGRDEVLPYVRLLKTKGTQPWGKGTEDRYPDKSSYRFEFYEMPPYRSGVISERDLLPVMAVEVHPQGQVVLDEQGKPTWLHQMVQDKYDILLDRLKHLEWREYAGLQPPPN